MNLRLVVPVVLGLTVLSGCNQPDSSAAPAVPPTEVAAVRTPPPAYPVELGCMGVGGTSVLSVVVGVEGKPTDVKVVTSSGNPQLDESARSRVTEWQFNAATRNGQPVPATIQVPVSFNPPQPRPDECFAIEERLRRGG